MKREEHLKLLKKKKRILEDLKILDGFKFLHNYEEIKVKLENELHLLENSENQFNLDRAKKLREFGNCNHFWIIRHNDLETKKTYRGCIKCGLDEMVMINKKLNTPEHETMRHYFSSVNKPWKILNKGYRIPIKCDFEEGKEIYKKLNDEYIFFDFSSFSKCFVKEVNQLKYSKHKIKIKKNKF